MTIFSLNIIIMPKKNSRQGRVSFCSVLCLFLLFPLFFFSFPQFFFFFFFFFCFVFVLFCVLLVQTAWRRKVVHCSVATLRFFSLFSSVLKEKKNAKKKKSKKFLDVVSQ